MTDSRRPKHIQLLDMLTQPSKSFMKSPDRSFIALVDRLADFVVTWKTDGSDT